MPRETSRSPKSDEGSITRSASAGAKARGEASLKRGRAESVEPVASSEPVTTVPKKNRLATGQTPSKPLDPDPTPNLDSGASASTQVPSSTAASGPAGEDIAEDIEGEAEANGTDIITGTHGLEKSESKDGKEVGEVRRKVAEMTYEEGKEGEVEGQEVTLPPKDTHQPDSAMSLETRISEGNTEISEKNQEIASQATEKSEAKEDVKSAGTAQGDDVVGDGLKRKALDRSTSSFVDESTVKRAKDGEAQKAETSTTAPESTAAASAPAPAPAKKPQATFGSFASASPFASAKPSTSPFASAGGASPFATAGASGSKPATASIFGSKSGFGNYSSSASPFAKAAPNATDSNNGDAEEKETAEEASEGSKPKAGAKAGATFGDILKADTGPERGGEEKVQMAEQDVYTGEEEEETVYQARAKLYILQADGGWRERGVGTVRLNVRRSDQKAPRLVMRAEGVLRLILNVSLYVGISCLEDGKHIRMSVFEDGEVKHITFRTGSNKTASEMYNAIHDHIPVESGTPGPTSAAEAV